MRKYGLILVSLLVLALSGCEGRANDNVIASIFIGNELLMLLVSLFIIITSVIALSSESGLMFYAKLFRRRRRWFGYREITEFDLVMSKISAWISVVLGVLIFIFSIYYLVFY